jgi:hypothetical protein
MGECHISSLLSRTTRLVLDELPVLARSVNMHSRDSSYERRIFKNSRTGWQPADPPVLAVPAAHLVSVVAPELTALPLLLDAKYPGSTVVHEAAPCALYLPATHLRTQKRR